jgi:hypothetical protein
MPHRVVCSVFFSLIGLTQTLTADEKADAHQDLFVIANVQFTLCHELTHALISTSDVPVLGREEDAADQVAAICFLHPTDKELRDPQAVEKLVAVADKAVEAFLRRNAAGRRAAEPPGLHLSR